MRRFYAQLQNISDKDILLDDEESKHLSRVLRLQIGDGVEVVDGEGQLYKAEVAEISKRSCRLNILETKKSNESTIKLWMAVAPTKNLNRWEWFLEKATEIGIGRISPILCQRSERKVLKIDRQLRILREAMKQSQRLYLPHLDEMMDFQSLIEKSKDFEGKKYIAHCEEGNKELLKNLHQSNENALILIGPEGDFHPDEISMAEANDFKAISLGESRLRTETAAIAACHTITLINA
ncbi:MAG: 16S rRNA (uracil(1498)-N(3))-methyltransferase [Flavobacteriales bacterium]|nr:16S rRNA (uracil(1498)-N(3))-methyltransferase [Flavobacteriales bacterium]